MCGWQGTLRPGGTHDADNAYPDSEEEGISRFWLALALMTLQFSAAAEGHPAFHIGVTNRSFLAGDESYDWRGAETYVLLTTVWYPTAPAERAAVGGGCGLSVCEGRASGTGRPAVAGQISADPSIPWDRRRASRRSPFRSRSLQEQATRLCGRALTRAIWPPTPPRAAGYLSRRRWTLHLSRHLHRLR